MLSAVPTLAQRKGVFFRLPALKNRSPHPPTPLSLITRFLSLCRIRSRQAAEFHSDAQCSGREQLLCGCTEPRIERQFVAKIDQRIGQSGNLSFRFMPTRSNSVTPYGNGANTGLFGKIGWSHNTLTGLTYTQSFTPQLVNEFRFGVTRTLGHGAGVHAGTNYNQQLGLPGPTDLRVIGFPEFLISGFAQIGDVRAGRTPIPAPVLTLRIP